MDPFVLTLIIVVVCVLLFINALVYGVKFRSEAVIGEVTQKFENSDENVILTDNWANFFGLKSLGGGQIRGNGILVLTDKKVYFARYFPKKEISISLESIKNVETVRTFLGKTKFSDLIKMDFDSDEVAFKVGETSEWIEKIKSAKS